MRDGSRGARGARRRRHRNRTPSTEGNAEVQVGPWLDRIPKWVPSLLFIVVPIVLFRRFVFSDLMLFGSDTLSLGYMARAFYAEALQSTGFPLWNPVILGGTPFLESLAGGDSLHPLSVALLMVMETYRSLGWKLILHFMVAGMGMFAWLRVLGTSRGASLVGGLAFLLAPYMVTLVFPGHDGKIFVTAMTPLLFWACEWSLRRGGLLPLSAIAAMVTLVILSTHFQMAYFLFGAVGAYMAFRCIQEGREGGKWRLAGTRFGAFLLFSVLGAGIAAVQLLPAVDYVTEHSRRAATTLEAEGPQAVAYSSSWSLHPEEIVSLAVPEFVGSSVGTTDWTTDTYWGRNPFKLNHEYLGIVALLLAALAFTGGRLKGLRWFMAGLGTVVVLFSLGTHTPVWRIFFEAVPGVSLFRAPSMAIFLTGFAVATLAGLGVDRAARLVDDGEWARVVRVLGVGAGLLAVGWLFTVAGGIQSLWAGVLYPEMAAAKEQALATAQPFIARGFAVAVGMGVLLAALWWAVASRYFPAVLLVPALALLVAADQWRVNSAFIEVMDHHAFASPDDNHRFLMERAGQEPPFRVLSLEQGGQDVRPGMFGLELAGGHHPNDLWRYRELIGMEGSGLPEHLARFHPNVLDVLNIRYVLWPEAQFGPLEGIDPVNRITAPDGRVLSAVYQLQTLPRARVVGEALVVSPNQTMETILDLNRYDPAGQVVLEVAPPLEPGGPDVTGQVRWVERSPDRLVLEVEASGPALLVVSENWFPAWTARVDGQETPVLRADHTLRAVAVPGGSHTVEFRYESRQLRTSLAISLLSLLVVAGAAGVDPVLARRRRRDDRKGAGGDGAGEADAPPPS
jgi:hypothetical protein